MGGHGLNGNPDQNAAETLHLVRGNLAEGRFSGMERTGKMTRVSE